MEKIQRPGIIIQSPATGVAAIVLKMSGWGVLYGENDITNCIYLIIILVPEGWAAGGGGIVLYCVAVMQHKSAICGFFGNKCCILTFCCCKVLACNDK